MPETSSSIDLNRVLDLAADVRIDDMWADMVGQSFTCTEMWWLADLLEALGASGVADALINNHRNNDEDEEDCHGVRR